MLYQLATEIEADDCGFHAVVYDVSDDCALYVSTSYATAESAERDARQWIHNHE